MTPRSAATARAPPSQPCAAFSAPSGATEPPLYTTSPGGHYRQYLIDKADPFPSLVTEHFTSSSGGPCDRPVYFQGVGASFPPAQACRAGQRRSRPLASRSAIFWQACLGLACCCSPPAWPYSGRPPASLPAS